MFYSPDLADGHKPGTEITLLPMKKTYQLKVLAIISYLA